MEAELKERKEEIDDPYMADFKRWSDEVRDRFSNPRYSGPEIKSFDDLVDKFSGMLDYFYSLPPSEFLFECRRAQESAMYDAKRPDFAAPIAMLINEYEDLLKEKERWRMRSYRIGRHC